MAGTARNSIGRFDNAGVLQNLVGTSAFGDRGFEVPALLPFLPFPGIQIIQAGQTWHFQAWFRDSAGGIAHSNFSSGFSFVFP